VAVYLIDRLGRRKLLLISIAGLTVGLLALGLSFFFEHEYAGYMAVASLVFYVAFFAIGMGPIPWTVNSEIYPASVRSFRHSTFNPFLTMRIGARTREWRGHYDELVGQSVCLHDVLILHILGHRCWFPSPPPFAANINRDWTGAFWTYAGIGVLAWIFMFFLLPETKVFYSTEY